MAMREKRLVNAGVGGGRGVSLKNDFRHPIKSFSLRKTLTVEFRCFPSEIGDTYLSGGVAVFLSIFLLFRFDEGAKFGLRNQDRKKVKFLTISVDSGFSRHSGHMNEPTEASYVIATFHLQG